jgi:hypothetical protein
LTVERNTTGAELEFIMERIAALRRELAKWPFDRSATHYERRRGLAQRRRHHSRQLLWAGSIERISPL